jgi:hypothetical protein
MPRVIVLDTFPLSIIIATTNVGHLSQFVSADLWTNIMP